MSKLSRLSYGLTEVSSSFAVSVSIGERTYCGTMLLIEVIRSPLYKFCLSVAINSASSNEGDIAELSISAVFWGCNSSLSPFLKDGYYGLDSRLLPVPFKSLVLIRGVGMLVSIWNWAEPWTIRSMSWASNRQPRATPADPVWIIR